MMKKCKNGHIYDDTKSKSYPFCKEPSTDCEGRCGNSEMCEEEKISGFSNIQGLQKSPIDNEFVTVDGLDNVTQDKTPLDHFICFYSMFTDGHTGDGKRAGGSHELIYDNSKRTVEEIHNFYGESVEGGKKVDYCLIVPIHIKFVEDLIEYIKSEKPEWEFYLKSYQPKRKPVNPPLMGSVVPKHLAGIPADPRTYNGINDKKKKQKNLLFGLLLAFGISVCVILIILISA